MYTNFKIEENGDGGDMVLESNDLQIDSGMSTAIYLQLFGDDGTGWWGNDLFDTDVTVSSETEAALYDNTTTESGLENIKIAVENDLSNLSELGTFVVSVTSDGYDKITIAISVDDIGSLQYVWNATKQELDD